VPVSKIEAVEKFTQPPPRFNSASLLRKMEEANIGTKATRAEIIEILYRRGYIAEARMRATPLALKMTELLKQHCPSMTDPGFTSQLEESMEKVQANTTSRRRVLVEALQQLRPVLLNLMAQEESLGAELADMVSLQKVAETSFDIPCPTCGSTLRIVRNRNTKKRFIGCSGKWEKGCNFSLPLPQFGSLSIAQEKCKKCDFQMVRVKVRGRATVSCSRCYAEKARERCIGTREIEKKLEVEV
jgi:DNA topoisomerase-1